MNVKKLSNIKTYFELIEHDFKVLDLLTEEYPPNLKNEDFSDWIITLLYYMSCIYIKAYFQSIGVNIQNHQALKEEISRSSKLYFIFIPYRKLEEASRDARYEGRKFKYKDIINKYYPKLKSIHDLVIEIFNKEGIENVPRLNLLPLLKRKV